MKKKAFSLLEALLVVSVIGVLGIIYILALHEIKFRGNLSKTAHDLVVISEASRSNGVDYVSILGLSDGSDTLPLVKLLINQRIIFNYPTSDREISDDQAIRKLTERLVIVDGKLALKNEGNGSP